MEGHDPAESAITVVLKKPSGRGKIFSPQELMLLARMYLHVSEDAAIGTNQRADAFWSRITVLYNAKKDPDWQERSQRSLNGKWYDASAACVSWSGILHSLGPVPPSGTAREDLVERAQQLFKAHYKTNFEYMGVWEILKDHPKWGSSAQSLTSPPPSSRKRVLQENFSDSSADSATVIERARPMGRDAAKANRRHGTYDETGHGATAAQLQQLVQDGVKNSAALERIAAAAEERNAVSFFTKFSDTPEAQQFFKAHAQKLLKRMVTNNMENNEEVEVPQNDF
jgi:hypothetical protein